MLRYILGCFFLILLVTFSILELPQGILYKQQDRSMLKSVLVDYNPVARALNGAFEASPLLQGLSDYVKSLLFNKDDENLQKLLFLTGVATLTYKASSWLYKNWRSWQWLPSHFANEAKLNGPALRKKYGDCWVLITGFTQGIGHGFAEIFAQFGFKLLLVSRHEERCRLKADRLRQKYKGIEIKYAACDMADKKEIPHLQRIFEEWKELDIGIVVNNAGTVAGGPYFSIDPRMLVDDINIDLLAVFLINRIAIPRMRTRNERSAIVNIASCTGVYLSPRVGVYSSTKRSIDVYSRILEVQNRDKIDVLSVRPFGVTTYMMKMKKGPYMITPRVCAFSSLADLLAGNKVTFSGFKHKLSSVAFQHLSEDECFGLYDFLWAQARAQAAD